MAALPYMQLYVADYLADTAHLSTLEHGAYLLLIFNYWQRGKPFEAKDERTLNRRLASVARMDEQTFNEVRETLADFFECTATEWRHKRIDVDLEAVNSKSVKARAAGKASGKARKNKGIEQTPNERSADDQRTLNHTEADTEADIDTDTQKREKPQKRKRFVRPSLSDVQQYIREIGGTTDGQQFIDFYESKGWKVGKNPMADWKACVRTWEKRNEADQRDRYDTDYQRGMRKLEQQLAESGEGVAKAGADVRGTVLPGVWTRT